jgi:hypothetical protein
LIAALRAALSVIRCRLVVVFAREVDMVIKTVAPSKTKIQQEFNRSGWRRVFGFAESKAVQRVDKVIVAEFERIDATKWR